MNGERGSTADECYAVMGDGLQQEENQLTVAISFRYQRSLLILIFNDHLPLISPAIRSFATRHSAKHRSSPRSLIKVPGSGPLRWEAGFGKLDADLRSLES